MPKTKALKVREDSIWEDTDFLPGAFVRVLELKDGKAKICEVVPGDDGYAATVAPKKWIKIDRFGKDARFRYVQMDWE